MISKIYYILWHILVTLFEILLMKKWEFSGLELSWVGIVLGGNFPGGNCPVGILQVAIFRVGVFQVIKAYRNLYSASYSFNNLYSALWDSASMWHSALWHSAPKNFHPEIRRSDDSHRTIPTRKTPTKENSYPG